MGSCSDAHRVQLLLPLACLSRLYPCWLIQKRSGTSSPTLYCPCWRKKASTPSLVGAPPGFVVAVPVDGRGEGRWRSRRRWGSSRFGAEFGGVDGVPQVMAGRSVTRSYASGGLAGDLQDHLHDGFVVFFAVGADEVGLADPPLSRMVSTAEE